MAALDLGVIPARGGLIARADLLAAGLTARDVLALAGSGALRRVARGVYTTDPPPPEARDLARERVRAELVRQPGVVATHASALLLHDVALLDTPTTVHIGRHDRAPVSRLADVDAHRLPPQCPVSQRVPWPTVPLAWALAQHAGASDLAAGVVPLDDALHRGRVSPDDLSSVAQALGTRKGTAGLQRAITLADPSCESPGETLTRLVLTVQLRLLVESQAVIHDREGAFVARVDFRLKGAPVVIEFDGALKYGGAGGRTALMREKQREDRLRALGYEVVRLTWADVHNPARVERLVRDALQRVEARRTR